MSDEPVQRRGLGARLGRLVLLGVGPLVLLVGGTYYYVISGRYVTTENANLKADKIAVSTDVSGPVAMVAVGENDQVVQGQTLFRIDERRYRIVLARKEAELRTARQNVEVLRALHRQKVAELERSEGLKKGGHVSQANYDKTRRDLLMARHRVEAVRQDIAGVLASLGGDPEAPNDRHPKVLEALTERERAQLDVLRTTVVAPLGAIVSNIDLQIGEYVTAGTPVFSLVAAERVWVQANLKETDLTHVRVGQQARVMVDAYPDHSWPARVASISPATGAEFALLPPQNASGNWVKVLRAGMSVEVEIDTKVARSLPGLIDSALAWVTGAR
jgi:membrane fusion protein (multidrug efflux system)